MVNIDPLTADIGSGVWGTPANYNGCSVLDTSMKIFQDYPLGARISKITRANKIFRHFPKWRPFWKMAAIFVQTRVLPQKYV